MNELSSVADIMVNTGLKQRKARPFWGRALRGGQLEERSEGVKAQWQTALGVVMAAGS